jgi:hypothetical protein
MLANEREEGLRRLLDGLIERLGRRVTVLTEHLVLCEEHALWDSHEDQTCFKR